MLIEHTVRGTVITAVTEDQSIDPFIMAEICPTKEKPVRFHIHIEKVYYSTRIHLVGEFKHYSYHRYHGNRRPHGIELSDGYKGEGVIMLNDYD